MAEAIEVVEEEEEEECPKCPPVGAPAWMATFADLATLLMAFFVLILSFAEMNVPKFKQISGSLKDSFGVQRVVPVVEQPKGTTILEMNFSPSPAPSVTEEMTQETTEIREPEVKIPSDDRDMDGEENLLEGAEDNEGLGGTDADTQSDKDGRSDAEELLDALQKIGEAVNMTAEMVDDKVVVDLNAEDASPQEMIEKFKRVGQAIEIAGLATGKSEQEVLFGGLDQTLNELISMVSELERQQDATGGARDQEQLDQNARAEQLAREAEAELNANLENEIDQGMVTVERRDSTVFVTLGAGGAFPSGSAELTGAAQSIVAELAAVTNDPGSKVVVAGHTDNVPIAFGALYRDNWDLAAARAASVVQEIEALEEVPERIMSATSYGETRPIADNETAEGRERNRRIEIEIDFE
ncbi:flagellar motor protein MotB [Thalassobacter stenotrophicus]|jgi:chemotaxis protein MotB|uniref:Root adhesin n=2 Tax=Thalassobacter stenotrophicus TaxID=266809 RepID=A0A0P1F1E1_9RHOB|nr:MULTISPECIES: OmpA family protein [Thalassobacter]KGK78704.1 flagellar motor protein MotB [Thalassobacter stenotrophicus]KGL00799.1 flagellar motor protein MotB [Thalassobacter sp. 16PALIMAR09]PVZ48582.1 flagellar motor protein MotB [Thalassobacter stenotrophicus]CUH61407.1 Root adhesin [Thalassobacter stenotrophicus]SHJ34148.1 chemotaxis protein MotB [Thalassobacter stenotrophicus DSM 16310]